MVADRERLVAFGFWLVPDGYRAEAKVLEEAVSRSFGGFIRGQVITGLVFGAICLLASVAFGLEFIARHDLHRGLPHGDPVLRAVRRLDPAGARRDAVQARGALVPVGIVVAIGWLVVMNWLQPRIMATSLRIHPIVVLGSVLVGLKIAGIPGAIFGIPIAAVISALFLHFARRGSGRRARRRARRRACRRARGPRRPPAARAQPVTDRDVEGVGRRRDVEATTAGADAASDATRGSSAEAELGAASTAALAASAAVTEDLARRVLAGAAGDAAAGVGAGAAQVQPLQRESVAGVAEQRAPDEELVEARPRRGAGGRRSARTRARGRPA